MKKKNEQKGINIYWIYGAIAIFFIGLQFFNSFSSSTEKITKNEFLNEFLTENEVEKVVIVNNEFVEVFIKESKLNKEKHKGIQQIGPHYYFNITSGEQFEEDLKEFYTTNKSIESYNQINVDVEIRKNIFGDMLGWIIPLAIMLMIWMTNKYVIYQTIVKLILQFIGLD